MKYSIYLALCLSIVWPIENLKAQDTLYVWAKSGLNMRAEASKQGKKLATIPFGASVIVRGEADQDFGLEDEFGLIYGAWLPVQYESYQGFVFDGYLKAIPLPKAREKDLNYFKRVFGPVQATYQTQDSKRGLTTQTQLLRHGISITNETYGEQDGPASPSIFLPQLKHHTAWLLAKYLYSNAFYFAGQGFVMTYNPDKHIIRVEQKEGGIGCYIILQLLQGATGGEKGVVINQYCGC